MATPEVTPETQLRQQIIDAAIALIGSQGLNQSTITEIAKRARVDESQIIALFESREAFLFAVAQRLFDRVRIDHADVFDESLSLRQRVINMVDYAVRVARYERDALRAVSILVNEERALQPVQQPIAEMIRAARKPAAEIIRRASAAREIRPIEPTVFFEFVTASIVGLHSYLRHHRKGYNPEPMYRAIRTAGLALIGLDEDGQPIKTPN